MSEYTAEREAERAKTARLKELRLAKQAVDKKAPPSKKTYYVEPRRKNCVYGLMPILTRCRLSPIGAFVLSAARPVIKYTVTNGIAAQSVDLIQLPRLRYPP